MKVTGETIIYRKEFNEKPAYSRRISSKKYENGKQLDEWIGTYESVQLPRGTELADKTKVNIKDSFESVFEKRDGTVQFPSNRRKHPFLKVGDKKWVVTGI